MNDASDQNPVSHEGVIAVVCALHLEVAPLLVQLSSRRTQRGNGLKFHECQFGKLKVVVVEGGVGYRRAQQATHAVIDAFQPDWILSIGLSGALTDHVKLREIVLGNAFIRENGLHEIRQRFEYLPQPGESLHLGTLCTAGHIVHTCSEKREIHNRTGAIAVDMESHAVASVSKDRATQFIAIRAISDDLSADLPKEVLAIFGPNGTIRTGALVGSIFKRPSSIKDLWKIRENAIQSAENLAKKTLEIIPQLIK